MEIKTSEASNKQLDWGVAVVLGVKPKVYCGRVETDQTDENYWAVRREFDHTDPAVCMGLIEQYSLAFSECDTRHLYDKPDTLWRVVCRDGSAYGESEVLAEAVARCVIAMKLGDEFECPDELGVMK